MNTETSPTSADSLPPDVQADLDAISAAISAGQRPDPEVARRVRERADRNRDEVFRKHGLLDIGVPAIRALRDGDDGG
jgi:hypothetical protein